MAHGRRNRSSGPRTRAMDDSPAVFKTACGALLRRAGWVRFPSIPASFSLSPNMKATTSLLHLLHRRGLGSPNHENAGATEPRRLPDEFENVRRSRYFFLAAFFLAAGFLAAFFFAAMLVYLLRSISDPMNGFGDGSQMHSSERSADSSFGRLCDASHEQHRFQTVVILEQDRFCQWISHDGFTRTVKRSSSAWPHSETAADGVRERGRVPHRP